MNGDVQPSLCNQNRRTKATATTRLFRPDASSEHSAEGEYYVRAQQNGTSPISPLIGSLKQKPLYDTSREDMIAHTSENLAGTWKLVCATASKPSGERGDSSFGPSPTGILIYTREGRMAVMISNSERKPLSADPFLASVEERAEAFTTFFAYAGRYTLTGDKLIHHVEISSLQDFEGTDQVRLIKFQGDRIVLVSPPMSINRKTQTFELVWERVLGSI